MPRFAARTQNESSKLPAALVESIACPPDRMSLLVPAPEAVSPLDADNVLTRKRIRNSRVSTANPACAQVVVEQSVEVMPEWHMRT
jgi:hypothetical protein